MTNEEEQLLLKDLCARLPYGVIAECGTEYDFENDITDRVKIMSVDNDNRMCGLLTDKNFFFYVPSYTIKPYLEPMSSMTNEEKKEYDHRRECMFYDNTCDDAFAVDWLNAHHFDYRGLIEKGLALEAPEGMYENGGSNE